MSAAATPRSVLRAALRAQRRPVVTAAALYMLWQACEALVPVAIGVVVDDAITDGDTAAVVWWLVALAVLFAVLSTSFRHASRAGTRAFQHAAHDLRTAMARRVLAAATVDDGTRGAATTVSIAGGDAERTALFVAIVPRVLGSVVSVAFAAVVVLSISVPLGLVVLVGCPVLLAFLRQLGRPLERRAATEQAHAADAAAVATDLVAGLRVLKGVGGERVAARRYTAASRRSLTATVRAARVEATYEAATLLCTLLFLAGVALVGGRLAAQGRIEVGQLVAAVGLAQFLLGPLDLLTSAGATLARARASAARVADVLNTPHHATPTEVARRPTVGVLDLGRPDVRIAAGDHVGIACDAATGGALIESLARARDDARVRLDGTALAQLDPSDVRDLLLVVPHDATLFSQSLLDNVRAGRDDDRAVRRAAAAADADEVADALPHGFDTRLTEQGRSLSGGQRQRVMLARALAADPLVLVLHDPTTAVDTATEARIAAGLRAHRAGRTTIVVTTSPALLAACDRVLHLAGDAVLGSGSHAQLSDDPGYRQLVFA